MDSGPTDNIHLTTTESNGPYRARCGVLCAGFCDAQPTLKVYTLRKRRETFV